MLLRRRFQLLIPCVILGEVSFLFSCPVQGEVLMVYDEQAMTSWMSWLHEVA